MTAPRTLSDALGGCKELAIFEAFALRPQKQLTATDVERMSGVSWATVHRRVDDWVDLELLVPTRRAGTKAHFFHLNLDSPTVVALTKAVHVARAELLQSELATIDGPRVMHPKATELADECRTMLTSVSSRAKVASQWMRPHSPVADYNGGAASAA
jgi:hypothetical protein